MLAIKGVDTNNYKGSKGQFGIDFDKLKSTYFIILEKNNVW